MKTYDFIVIGAGHNGLVCATILAKAGRSVLLVEAAAACGGLADEREFHPGFKAAPAHTITHFSKTVIDSLDLKRHGLAFSPPMATVGLSPGGNHVRILGDEVLGVSDEDRSAYARYRQILLRFAEVMNVVWAKTLPRIGAAPLKDALAYAEAGLKMRMLGKEDMREFLRILTLPMRDLMTENFENPILQAALSWDGLIGSKMAPRSPNGAVLALLLRMSGLSQGDHVVPAGGVKALISALIGAAQEAGVEIRTGAAVRRISIEGGDDGLAVTGVELDGGEMLAAKSVVSSADPKRTFFDLVGARHLEIEFTNRINRLRCDGYVAKFHGALSAAPVFKGLEDANARLIIAPHMDAIEFAYDDAKYGEPSHEPVMEIVVRKIDEQKHVLSAHVMYAPYKADGWSADERTAFSDRIIATIEQYAPGFQDQLVHHELITPNDIERDYHVTGGHWHHAEFALDQMMMMRPTYEAAQYRTPLAGLYLCGAGCHPGGGLMGTPGFNAAREILK